MRQSNVRITAEWEVSAQGCCCITQSLISWCCSSGALFFWEYVCTKLTFLKFFFPPMTLFYPKFYSTLTIFLLHSFFFHSSWSVLIFVFISETLSSFYIFPFPCHHIIHPYYSIPTFFYHLPFSPFLFTPPLKSFFPDFLSPFPLSLSAHALSRTFTMPPQIPSQNQSGPRILQGDLSALSPAVREFLETNMTLCQPESIHICDGSDEENLAILTQLEEQGMIKKLTKYENWYVCYTQWFMEGFLFLRDLFSYLVSYFFMWVRVSNWKTEEIIANDSFKFLEYSLDCFCSWDSGALVQLGDARGCCCW